MSELGDKKDNIKSFSRRAFVIGCAQGGVLAVLAGRLAWLQLAQGQKYKMLADKNRIDVKIIAPSRGEIVDRHGTILAKNKQNFRVLLVPEQAGNIEQSLRALQSLIGLSDNEVVDALSRAKKIPKFVPLEVKDQLQWEDVAKIEVNLPDLPGLSINVGELRNYPLGDATAHLVGYVSAVSESEIGRDPVLSLPGFKTGKTGIEKQFDLEMRGQAGTSNVEVNVIGREVRELDRQNSVEGKRVALTIDAGFQRFMQDRLAKERSASAVVMDAETGAVYGLASHPSFDPNLFTSGLSATRWEELLADPGHPLTNKAVAGQYPPASTFKMITALAGLRAGIIKPNTRVYCSGHYDYGTDRFHCWKTAGHGSVDLYDALAMSCDTYFYELSTQIGIENIAKAARMMGFGDKLDFDLYEERPGLVPDKNWKLGHFDARWQPGETIVASIGQGYLQATPLQMATMTARLVNGGYEVKPWLTAFVGQQDLTKEAWKKMDIDPAHLSQIKEGMNRVVNHETGTALGSRIHEAGMEMGGKTGTAQVKRITMRQRSQGVKNEDLNWKSRHHALFVGYAPIEKPRYVCAVVVEHGVGGSRTAAPMGRDLLLEVQKRAPAAVKLQPSGTL